jgi:hypothetical protein
VQYVAIGCAAIPAIQRGWLEGSVDRLHWTHNTYSIAFTIMGPILSIPLLNLFKLRPPIVSLAFGDAFTDI